jgi:hypothetical protein
MRTPRFPLLCSPYLVLPDEIEPLAGVLGVGAGTAWPSANVAIYTPFSLPVDARVNGVSFNCTAGNSAGRNFDLGIFDAATNTKLSSTGATAMALGTNTWAADQQIIGGASYYVGLSVNSTALFVWSTPTAVIVQRVLGFAQEASAEPLPATATPAQVAFAYVPFIAMTFSSVAQ